MQSPGWALQSQRQAAEPELRFHRGILTYTLSRPIGRYPSSRDGREEYRRAGVGQSEGDFWNETTAVPGGYYWVRGGAFRSGGGSTIVPAEDSYGFRMALLPW